MAADWIKMRVDLYRDPKVCVIADELFGSDSDLARYVDQNAQRAMTVTRNVTRNATVGALVAVWGVMRQRGSRQDNDLVCRGVSLRVIDDVSDLPGFGEAMASVGWVAETDNGIVFPEFFDEYNVDPKEQKASASAERQRRYRERNKRDSDVTGDVTRDVTVTHREEKRREEKKEQKKDAPDGATPSSSTKAKSTTLTAYLTHCEARDVAAIPEDDAVFAWAESVRLPAEYVGMAWRWFKAKYGPGGDRATKRYADWRAVFRNAVKDGWPKYWGIGQDGAYYLTTQGKQAQMAGAQ